MEGRTLFSSLSNITNLPNYEVAPDIVADSSGGLHATYQGGPANAWHVMYMYKPSGGSWTTPLDVGGANIADPHIAVGGSGNPHIVYAEGNEIYYVRKFGGVWTSPLRISTAAAGRSVEPDIAIDGLGRIHVAWHDETDGGSGVAADWDIRTRTWDAGAWGTETAVTTDAADDLYPALAAGGSGALYVVWHNTGTNQPVLFRKRDAAGTWGAIERVDTSVGRSFNPSIAIDSGGILHVAWHDDASGNWNINYRSRHPTSGWGTMSTFDTGSADDVFAHVAVNPVDQSVAVGWVDFSKAFLVRKAAGGSFGSIKTVATGKGAKDNSLVFDTAGNVNFVFQGNQGGTNGNSWDLWHYIEDINGN